VKQIFTLCGGHISPILVGCKRLGIRVIDTRDEASAAFAADATSRLTGIPGVTGTTLLGDGRVLLVLDIGELLQ